MYSREMINLGGGVAFESKSSLSICSSCSCRRYVANETLFKELVACAEASPYHRYVLGGNAPVMAQRMALEGLDVLLGARLTPDVSASLPKSVKGLLL